MFYLYDEHDDEYEDESRAEVGDVKGGAKAADQGVTADDRSQQHGRHFHAEILQNTTKY